MSTSRTKPAHDPDTCECNFISTGPWVPVPCDDCRAVFLARALTRQAKVTADVEQARAAYKAARALVIETGHAMYEAEIAAEAARQRVSA